MKGLNVFPSVILPIHRHLQKTEHTCGPASLRIVIETLNGRDRLPTETQIEVLCLTNPQTGTDPDMMINTLEYFGVRHTVPKDATLHTIEQSIRHFSLCLVDFQAYDDDRSHDGHYAVVFGFNETHFFVADPYRKSGVRNKEWGFRTIRKDLFERRWHARYADGVRATHWMVAIPFV